MHMIAPGVSLLMSGFECTLSDVEGPAANCGMHNICRELYFSCPNMQKDITDWSFGEERCMVDVIRPFLVQIIVAVNVPRNAMIF